ncbi:hypothetical protein DM01DRAFT_1111163 [Hesseltinella vesiculosa]|uniref:Zn(2)-C6 fungal-type domain-containing protein n=1 Tax=Hesseltinella vesiculosa TaxID=101127 RepID=A0A1X2GAI8_9FUNG|nr:hypothetical protein DM01DRAFT_1111163 [Hesseltinella vesiculosa]
MPPKRALPESADPPTAINGTSRRNGRESKKCNECRRRHVKCDEQHPKCSNCVKANVECSYSHRGVRYDHISDRQKRDDVYTEIEDISTRVETLLKKLQTEPVDDVARLAKDYGWEVSISENGQKCIVTNIETTSQLAALVPRALSDVYVSHPYQRYAQPTLSASSSAGSASGASLASSPSSSHGYSPLFSPIPSQQHGPTTLKSTAQSKARKSKRVTLERYVAAYTNPSIHMLSTAIATCPCLFTAIMSPRFLACFAGHAELSMLHTSACCTLSLNSCSHNSRGLFSQSSMAAAFDATPTGMLPVGSSATSSSSDLLASHINKDLSHYLGTNADDTTLFPTHPRFGEVSLSNLYWNLLKTAKLLDDGNFSQAFVNLGVMITKAFSLKLHRPEGYTEFATPLQREVAKRIFWAIWLFDTQMPLLQEGRPSIKLDDITIDKPSYPVASQELMQANEEDIAHTECLRYLVETRWIRVQLENTLCSFQAWDDDKAVLSMIIQQMRMLRRFYEMLDSKFKLEAYLKQPPTTQGWQLRAHSILLLEHAMNWLVLFDRFLPLRNEEMPVTPFPANLAIHFCREAANVMTLVFEKWLEAEKDCQFRWFFSHFVNCLEIHKVSVFLISHAGT